eukprot:3068717-Prymnesium_polylepis.1
MSLPLPHVSSRPSLFTNALLPRPVLSVERQPARSRSSARISACATDKPSPTSSARGTRPPRRAARSRKPSSTMSGGASWKARLTRPARP